MNIHSRDLHIEIEKESLYEKSDICNMSGFIKTANAQVSLRIYTLKKSLVTLEHNY